MRVFNCMCGVLLSLSTFWLSGCATVPDLTYSGPVKDEDVAHIRRLMADKGLSEDRLGTEDLPLAVNMFFFPLLYMKGDQLIALKVEDSVVKGCDTGDPILYSKMRWYGAPLLCVDACDRRVSPDGRSVWRHDWSSLSLLLWTWGDFEYAGRRNVPKRMRNTGIPYNLLNPFVFAYPSQWFFTGTKGSYWHGPLWLFGHISTDLSDTFTLFNGWIPICYRNDEPPGAQ